MKILAVLIMSLCAARAADTIPMTPREIGEKETRNFNFDRDERASKILAGVLEDLVSQDEVLKDIIAQIGKPSISLRGANAAAFRIRVVSDKLGAINTELRNGLGLMPPKPGKELKKKARAVYEYCKEIDAEADKVAASAAKLSGIVPAVEKTAVMASASEESKARANARRIALETHRAQSLKIFSMRVSALKKMSKDLFTTGKFFSAAGIY